MAQVARSFVRIRSKHLWVTSLVLPTLLALLTGARLAASSGTFTAAENHGLMLNSDGSVCAVGQNQNGELGDGTSVDQSTPVKLSEFAGASYLYTGWYHTVALKTDGTVWAWGYNGYGELGDGSNYNKPTPNQVPGLSGIIAVAAGAYHSLALKSDGTVWGWGYNGDGELGDGTTTLRYTPVQTITLSGVIAIAAGDHHSLALKSDGTVWAWGYNGYGQLGDGTQQSRVSPVQVANLSGVTAIAGGNSYSLALESDGSVWGWGANGQGQLGDGSNVNRVNVVRSGSLTGVSDIAAGDGHSLAVGGNGSVWAWGQNIDGELGNNSTTASNTPIQVTGLGSVVRVAAGVHHSTALKSDGSMWAWGDNTYGQLGTGNNVASLSPVASLACSAIPPAPGRSYSSNRLRASEKFSMAVRNDGTVWAWGQNTNGQLGNGNTTNQSSPVQAASLTNVTGIATGWYHSLAVKNDGTVWAWGYNGYGELGSGNTNSQPTPNPVPGLTGMVAVAAGAYHSVALKSDGSVWGWGYNGDGELGDGTTNERFSPVLTIGISGVIAIAAGDHHTLALKSDGTVWTWGWNGYGQQGDGTLTSDTSPVQVANLSGVIAISGGNGYSLALKSDGTVWGWGAGGAGQLGDGANQNRTEVVRTSGLTDIVGIAAGDGHSMAVRSDGTVWTWGLNTYGQLGNGTTTNSNIPVEVIVQSGVLTNAVAVAAGVAHSLALTSDGTIWAWGLNDDGQFGEASPASSTVALAAVAPGIGGVVTLTLNVSGSGTLTADPPSTNGAYPAGTQVCLTAVPNSGSVLSSISGVTLDSFGCFILNANTTVTANFITPTPLSFVPITPCRAVDTRNPAGPLAGPSIAGGGSRSFAIAGNACGIPANAQAYSLNAAIIPTSHGYMTMWPTGQPQPGTASVNSPDGGVHSSGAIVPAGTGGAISVFALDTMDVVLDVNGYFVTTSGNPSALAFYPLTPCRVVDTRNANGNLAGPFLAGGSTRDFPLLEAAATCNISSSAEAYSLNIAVVPRTGVFHYLTAWPGGQSQPAVATLNDPQSINHSNAAIVPAAGDGSIDVYVTNDTDLVMDINGYFAPQGTGGLSLYTLEPCRVIDTRNPSGAPPFTGTITVNVEGSNCGAPSNAQGYVFNATAIPQAGSHGFLTLWQDGAGQPTAANLNAPTGATTGNMAIVPTTNGSIDAYFSGATWLVLDIFGYFAP